MSVQLAINSEGIRFSARVRLTPEFIERSAVVLGIFIASRLFFLALGYLGERALRTIPKLGAAPFAALVAAWSFGDQNGYVNVVRNGYWFDPILRRGTPIPFPLYPWLVSDLSARIPDLTLAGVILSSLCAAISLLLLSHLLVPRVGGDVAVRTCLLVALFPFSFILSAPDARSLVFLGAVCAVLAEAQGRVWLATAAAALASLAAPVGLLLWPALTAGRVARWTRRNGTISDVVSLALGIVVTGRALLSFFAHLAALSFPPPTVLTLLVGKPVIDNLASSGLLSTSTGVNPVLPLVAALVIVDLLTLPRVYRTLGAAAAVYVVLLVAFAAARFFLVDELIDSAATLILAFPSAVIAAELLRTRSRTIAAIGASAMLVAGVAFVVVGAPEPQELGAARPFADTTLTTFHVDFARKYPGGAPPRDLYLSFDKTFVILGDQPPETRYKPGDSILVPYYLDALKAPTRGYLLSLRLRDLDGRLVARSDRVLWGNADASLSPAPQPTISPGSDVQMNLALPLAPNFPTGIYTLDTEVFALPTFQRLSLLPTAGTPVDQVDYARLVIAAPGDFGTESNVVPPRPLRLDSDAAISLLGYDVQRQDQGIDVSLYWKATARPAYNYTAFVQALDSAGKVVAQSDSYPAAGEIPTSDLNPGDVVRDVHALALPPSMGDGKVRLIAGLYRLETMQRVNFHPPGEATTTDHAELGEADVTASR